MSWVGYGPVIDLAKDLKNAKLVTDVRLPSSLKGFPVVLGTLTVESVILSSGEPAHWSVVSAMDPRQYLILAAILSTKLTRSYSSAFIQARDSNGKSIFEGKRVTALSNAEEKEHGLPLEVGNQHISSLQRRCALSANKQHTPRTSVSI